MIIDGGDEVLVLDVDEMLRSLNHAHVGFLDRLLESIAAWHERKKLISIRVQAGHMTTTICVPLHLPMDLMSWQRHFTASGAVCMLHARIASVWCAN